MYRKKEVQRYHRVCGCSKGHISIFIEILLKEELIVGLSKRTPYHIGKM